jgi:hypothetical protein
MNKQFQISIETNTTSEGISSHQLLKDAKMWVDIYLTTKKSGYIESENPSIVIWEGDYMVQYIPFF